MSKCLVSVRPNSWPAISSYIHISNYVKNRTVLSIRFELNLIGTNQDLHLHHLHRGGVIQWERPSVLVPTFQAVRWYVHPSGLYQTSPHRLSGARPCRWKWFWSKIEYCGQSLYGNNSIWAPELYQGEKLEETQSRPTSFIQKSISFILQDGLPHDDLTVDVVDDDQTVDVVDDDRAEDHRRR